jgi:hypothetical protein
MASETNSLKSISIGGKRSSRWPAVMDVAQSHRHIVGNFAHANLASTANIEPLGAEAAPAGTSLQEAE